MRGGGWEAGGSWDEIDWNSTTNSSWHKLSVVLHPADLLSGRRAGVTLINGIGPFGDGEGLYFTYWQDPSGVARSTTLWENLSVSYTPVAGTVPTKIGVAKTKVDGTPVEFAGKVVTAIYPAGAYSRIYIEESERSAGIWVDPVLSSVPADLALNETISLTGYMATDDQTGERYIAEAQVGARGSGSVDPVAMSNLSIGGSTVSGGSGRDNAGMLVTACGRVKALSLYEPNVFYIDDGSDVAADYPWNRNEAGMWQVMPQERGVKVYHDGSSFYMPGQYVMVTGVAGVKATDSIAPPPAHSSSYRCIFTRGWMDIKPL
jgi:hypothetical protein